jgi:hypothetical protein
VAAVDLERALLGVVAGVDHLAGKSLDHRGRQHLRHLGEVGAAQNATQALLDRSAKTLEQIQADQARIGVSVVAAVGRVGHPQRFGTGFDDVELLVDDQAQQHLVHRFAGAAGAGGHRGVAGLGVDEAGIDFPKAVAARIDLHVDAAAMPELALGRGGGQCHREGSRTGRGWVDNDACRRRALHAPRTSTPRHHRQPRNVACCPAPKLTTPGGGRAAPVKRARRDRALRRAE